MTTSFCQFLPPQKLLGQKQPNPRCELPHLHLWHPKFFSLAGLADLSRRMYLATKPTVFGFNHFRPDHFHAQVPEQVPKGLRWLLLVSVNSKNALYVAPPKVSSGYENVITQVPLACTSGGANVGTWAVRKFFEAAKSMLKTLIAPPGLIRTGKAGRGAGGG